jgi:hypothetical protein
VAEVVFRDTDIPPPLDEIRKIMVFFSFVTKRRTDGNSLKICS